MTVNRRRIKGETTSRRGRRRLKAPDAKVTAEPYVDKRQKHLDDVAEALGPEKMKGMVLVYGDPEIHDKKKNYYKREGWEPAIVDNVQEDFKGDPIFLRSKEELDARIQEAADDSIGAFDGAFEGEEGNSGLYGVRDEHGEVHGPFRPDD